MRTRLPATIEIPGPDSLGPCMNALSDRERAFVIALYALACRDPVDAARAAGYTDNANGAIRVAAHRLMHRDTIQAAILEEGKRRMKGLMPVAMKHLGDIIENPQHKQQVAAIFGVLNRGGLHEVSEAKHVHEIVMTRDQKIEEIKQFATQLGIDPRKLLGRVVDAEFEEIPLAPDGEPW